MLHAFVHFKSIFLGACVITWVTLQRYFRWWWGGGGVNTYLILWFIPFLRWICSEKALFGHVCWGGGSKNKGSGDTYSHQSRFFSLDARLFFMVPVPVNSQCIPFRTFLFTLIALELLIFLFLLMDFYDFWSYVFCKFFFLLYLYSHWAHSCWSSVSITTITWSYHKVVPGKKG